VSRLEQALAEVEEQLACPPSEWSPQHVAEAATRHASINAQLEQALAAWEGLHGEDQQVAAELTRLKEGVANGGY